MNVAPISLAELMGDPAFPALVEEYAAECLVEGLPHPSAKLASYLPLEGLDWMRCLAARTDEGALVGFITVVAPVMLHFDRQIAASESFFLTVAHRGLTSLKLLVEAEKTAKAMGSPGLFVCAPFGGRLFELLPKCGYAETNRVFFKKIDQ